jgi:hypothetical protein
MSIANGNALEIQGGQSFVRARARLRRLSDNKSFAGYIESISHIGISIRLNASDTKVACGDKFSVEVTGLRQAAALSVEVIATEGALVHQVLLRPVSFHTKTQDVRVLMFGEPCRICHEGSAQPALSIDIAENGIGVLTHSAIPALTPVDIEIYSPIGLVTAKGEIRYCQPDLAAPNQFRAGIRLNEFDEVSRERWSRIMNSALASRSE